MDDVRVDDVRSLTAGTDDDLLVLEPGHASLVRASSDGEVDAVGLATMGGGMPETGFGVAPDGGIAVARGVGPAILVRGFDWSEEGDFETAFPVGAIALDEDRSMLLGSRDDTRIDMAVPAGVVQGLLGPPGSDAAVILDASLGPVGSLMRLDDGRVVFVAETPEGPALHLLDNTEARPIDSPVGASCGRACMTPIAPAPGGRVLTTGIGRDGDPVISVVDVDSGEVEELAVLEGVEPSIERPVSAVAVGQDLVFLADGKLWKLAGAFA